MLLPYEIWVEIFSVIIDEDLASGIHLFRLNKKFNQLLKYKYRNKIRILHFSTLIENCSEHYSEVFNTPDGMTQNQVNHELNLSCSKLMKFIRETYFLNKEIRVLVFNFSCKGIIFVVSKINDNSRFKDFKYKHLLFEDIGNLLESGFLISAKIKLMNKGKSDQLIEELSKIKLHDKILLEIEFIEIFNEGFVVITTKPVQITE